MFGFIKNLFNGIIGFFTGLFGSKKSQDNQLPAPKAKKGGGYYMQLDESEDNKLATASKSAQSDSATQAKKSEKPEPSKTELAAEPKKSEPAKAEQAKAPAPAAKAEPVKTEPVTEMKKPEPVAVNNGKSQSQSTTTFATDYLIAASSSRSRRRPGPSMDGFRDMARQVKTSS